MALIDPVRAPVTGRGRIIYHVENIIRVACEATAAAMVCVEILLLLTSIIGRALGVALVWTDEIEAVAFMWLAMLGAVIALQRGRHMRMTALVNRLSVRGQRLAATIALGTCALFVLLLLPDAISYAQGQAFISSPALGIPDSWRAGALPVGFGLMSVLCITQLLTHRLRDVALVLAGLALIGALLWLATPLLQTIGNWNLVIFFVVLVAAGVLAGIPIGFVFGIATYSYLACAGGIPLSVMVGRLDDGMNSMILVAVPLFVFLGMLIEMTGMAAAMVDFLASLVGHVRGGLCYVLLGAMYLVSGISGAKAADMAAV
ncbi:MAG TPA: TRAP transporter small permease subunit, partial [Acetobacteraceae bacterium]|nr:TRAP transporter small permease subunit [Acetobacteraceae bacterium]